MLSFVVSLKHDSSGSNYEGNHEKACINHLMQTVKLQISLLTRTSLAIATYIVHAHEDLLTECWCSVELPCLPSTHNMDFYKEIYIYIYVYNIKQNHGIPCKIIIPWVFFKSAPYLFFCFEHLKYIHSNVVILCNINVQYLLSCWGHNDASRNLNKWSLYGNDSPVTSVT